MHLGSGWRPREQVSDSNGQSGSPKPASLSNGSQDDGANVSPNPSFGTMKTVTPLLETHREVRDGIYEEDSVMKKGKETEEFAEGTYVMIVQFL
jgi:hypothetical protein